MSEFKSDSKRDEQEQDAQQFHQEVAELQPPQNLKSIGSVSKNIFLKDLLSIKTLMEKRLEQRGLTLYYLTNNKFQSALIYCRQLTFSSHKIFKEYQDSFNQQFQQNFFERTSKAKEHLQYLLDCTIACRVFLQAKKKEDAIDILDKVQINEHQKERQVIIKNEADKVRFNEVHEIMAKMCAILLTFIDIAKNEKLYDYCQKFFKRYVTYVKNNYGIIEYSTALFKYGVYLYQVKSIEKAQQAFKACVQIRKKNVINSCLVDALINLAICQRQLAQYQQAMNNTRDALQIYRDIKINDQGIDKYYLLLAKLCLEAAQFEESYVNFLRCLKHRESLPSSDPSKVEIQLNLMNFYKVLKEMPDRHKEVLYIDDKKIYEEKKRQARSVYQKMRHGILEREQFAKYRDFKSSKFSHLSLFITKDFFDALSASQVKQLNTLLTILGDMNYGRGLAELMKCKFWQQKKLRDLLIESNAHLKKGVIKKSSQTSSRI